MAEGAYHREFRLERDMCNWKGQMTRNVSLSQLRRLSVPPAYSSCEVNKDRSERIKRRESLTDLLYLYVIHFLVCTWEIAGKSWITIYLTRWGFMHGQIWIAVSWYSSQHFLTESFVKLRTSVVPLKGTRSTRRLTSYRNDMGTDKHPN